MMLSAPATLLTAAVNLLAVLIALWTAILVSRTRRRVGISPPAMSGSPELDCAVRVQANTVEQFIIFLPALWLAAIYFQGWIPPLVGLAWCLGRIVYALCYTAGNPGKRAPGFLISIISTLALVILALFGLVQAAMVS
jgi:glutathione S-transferase